MLESQRVMCGVQTLSVSTLSQKCYVNIFVEFKLCKHICRI